MTSPAKVIHENETYVVTTHDNHVAEGELSVTVYPFGGTSSHPYPSGYLVLNKKTSVVEYATSALPDAVQTAEAMNDSLLLGAWKWLAVRRQAIKEGRIPDENAVFLDNMERQHAVMKRPKGASEELIK